MSWREFGGGEEEERRDASKDSEMCNRHLLSLEASIGFDILVEPQVAICLFCRM